MLQAVALMQIGVPTLFVIVVFTVIFHCDVFVRVSHIYQPNALFFNIFNRMIHLRARQIPVYKFQAKQ